MTRPGYPERYTSDQFDQLSQNDVDRLNELVVAMPPEPMSSTQIRRLVAQGKAFRHLVPPRVADYILQNGLYRDSPPEVDWHDS